MAPISEQKRNLRFLFVVIILITVPCYCLGFVVMNLANRVSGIAPLPTDLVLPTNDIPTATKFASLTPELIITATLGTQTLTITHTATVTKTRFLTPTPTETLTPTMTATFTATNTLTPTSTSTNTATATSTQLPLVIKTPDPVETTKPALTATEEN